MRILVTGASGQLGSYLLEELRRKGVSEVIPWSRSTTGSRTGLDVRPVDLGDETALAQALDDANPDVVIHAAAISTAEQVRLDPDRARAVNVGGTRQIAAWCGNRGRRLIFTSTDLVFDGETGWYREDDETRPVLAYGQNKAEAEPSVLQVPAGIVARISLLYGPSCAGRDSFFDKALGGIRAGRPQVFFRR